MKPGILVFKTDIRTQRQAAGICNLLSAQESVVRCTVDMQDCDKILRVEVKWEQSSVLETLVRQQGFFIEELPD